MTKTYTESVAKYAGFATVGIEWSALLFYYLKMPQYFGNMYPISHFATLPETRWVFTICYVLAAISFWIFTRHHLSRHYTIPTKTFGVSLLLLAGTGLFPFDYANTASLAIHTCLALSSGVLFIAGIYIMAKNSNDQLLFNVSLLTIIFSFMLTVAFLLSPKESPLVFAFEAISWLMLQLWTIWISFYIRRNEKVRNS